MCQPSTTEAPHAPTPRQGTSIILCSALAFLALSSHALADIYKWNDERGKLVVSNVPPAEKAKVKNFQLIMKEIPAPVPAAAPATHVTTPTERALLQRIENLEGELQAQRYATAAVAAPTQYAGYYAPPVPPPPVYYPSYYPNAYPIYYPSYYYRAVPSYGHATYGARTMRPGFGFAHGPVFRGGGGHRGRR